ncbi:MAG: glycerophosphodiester phosphodiesterase [Promethearchaeota archaeon]
MKPYIFGHRGASGYEIENTIPSFKKAVNMGAGIEADIQLTKDDKLICFHDPYLKIGNKYYSIQNFTLEEINAINFSDNRKIPLVEDLFNTFKKQTNNIRYSFDIANRKTGLKLLNTALESIKLERMEITDRRLIVLSALRKNNELAKLVYTLREGITRISEKTINLEKLRKLDVQTINVRCKRNIEELFKDIIDFGLRCYIWGVNSKKNMHKVVRMNYRDEIVSAIYTDYPDILLNLIMEHFK